MTVCAYGVRLFVTVGAFPPNCAYLVLGLCTYESRAFGCRWGLLALNVSVGLRRGRAFGEMFAIFPGRNPALYPPEA